MTPNLQAAYDILKASHAAMLELGLQHRADPVTHKAILKLARANLDVMKLIYGENHLIEVGEEAVDELLRRILAKGEGDASATQ